MTDTLQTSKAWHFCVDPKPFRMLICAVKAVESPYRWFYFIGYYVPAEKIYYDPCNRQAYRQNVVAGWREFTETLEGLELHYEIEAASPAPR